MAVLTGKYKTRDDATGKTTLADAISTSAGAADGNKIVKTTVNGVLHETVMPPGIGSEMGTATPSENISGGDLINLWNDSGTLKMRKADAASAKEFNGFVRTAQTTGVAGNYYLPGQQNDAVTGLTIGATYYLSSTVPGGVVTAPVFTSGYIIQKVGIAESATLLNTGSFEAETVA